MAGASLRVRIDRRKLDALIRETPERADDMLLGAAEAMLGEIKLSFGTGKQGRKYRRRKDGAGAWHIASAPGGPPAIDMGALAGGMRVERVRRLEYRIADSVAYGVFLEYGTSKMAARPFVMPVVERWRAGGFAAFAASAGFIP